MPYVLYNKKLDKYRVMGTDYSDNLQRAYVYKTQRSATISLDALDQWYKHYLLMLKHSNQKQQLPVFTKKDFDIKEIKLMLVEGMI